MDGQTATSEAEKYVKDYLDSGAHRHIRAKETKKRPDGTLQPSKFLSPRDNFALLCEANFEPESYKILARSMHIISFFSNLTISLINPFQTKK